jgi:histidinol-phosphate aminotransferase
MILDLVREELRGFAGYSSARQEAQGGEILLNANESPWPQPDDVLGLNRYPDPQPEALKQRLADLYGVTADAVLIGRGSDEPFDLLVRALCRAGRDSVLISPPTFGMYAVCARVQDAGVTEVPLLASRGFTLDVDHVLARVDAGTRIVFVCSPNNPTGRSVPPADLRRLADGLRGRALLVIDEAYAEFSAYASAIELIAGNPFVAVLRTLSKAYALAGARIGCLIADPALIGVLRAIMAPYPLPTPCVQAALHALAPEQMALARTRIELIRGERTRLAERLKSVPGVLEVQASDANFLLVRFEDAAGAYALASRAGIVLRDLHTRPLLAGCLRISMGTPEQNRRLLAVLANTGAAV